MILRLINKYNELIKFGLVGIINTLIDYLVYSIIIFFVGHGGILLFIAQACGYTAGSINSYIMNKIWTFEKKEEKTSALQLVRFFTVNLASLGITTAGLYILVQRYNMNPYIAKIFIIIIAQAVNYLGYKFWVFDSNNKK